jgi:SagB-type dehydrogenase family enzyme
MEDLAAAAEPPTVRVRRARSVVFGLEVDAIAALNFFTRQAASLDEVAFTLLQRLEAWTDAEHALAALGESRRGAAAEALIGLIDHGLVVVEGTDEAATDERVEREWEWGASAGHFHFGLKDVAYDPPEVVAAMIEERARDKASVPLYLENDSEVEMALPTPSEEPLLAVMRRRRSCRAFDAEAPLPLAALADCLFAGLGIVGFARSPSGGPDLLPMTMTPSGGARNPYEAFVFARAVESLPTGTYHYSALGHSLAPVATAEPFPRLGAVLGGQEWFDDAGAIVVLVASLQRTMWKYPHPGGLRVVLIEAGHVAQNMLLCAARHGLAAAPTCALADGLIERLTGADRVTQAACHAVALGVRSPTPSTADPGPLLPHPAQ